MTRKNLASKYASAALLLTLGALSVNLANAEWIDDQKPEEKSDNRDSDDKPYHQR
ncbi:MAG TPA: hypothetical protein PLY23_08750 [Alphaproteobacteria bacterium]|nr:hypothetical protein [Alphaproteobacteria bacterium]HQS94752.1 hypothetical protein [Alphaproteobacteria bacterium]